MDSPLCKLISAREIHSAGFTLQSKVVDIWDNRWTWPSSWNARYGLGNISNPNLIANKKDCICICWRDEKGFLTDFSVKVAWHSLCQRMLEVDWWRIVWFSQCIPRYAFLVWLITNESLKTQDKLQTWNVPGTVSLSSLVCPLGKLTRDSHKHIFFECIYSILSVESSKKTCGYECCRG